MKLARYGAPGQEKPGLIDGDGRLRDLSGVVTDLAGDAIGNAGLRRLAAIDPSTLPLVEGKPRYGAPVSGIGKMICVGMNYADHAAETGAPVPEQPVLFMKATTAIGGPNDTVVIPRGSVKTDWEVELGVIIGEITRDVSVDDALDHVAGYAVINDLSERAFQLEHGGQWVKGKSCDTFGPIGPWLVTRDEVAEPQNLSLWLEVNGHRYQAGNTRTMVFGVAALVSYISRYMTLMPGDVISTGTPAGVGLGLKPPTYLKPGDVIELGIEGLGRQRQDVVAHPSDRS
ncbi:fumarylacetoacetate hydrolase family protein [Luteibacter aegosomatis]|uniref:fumarylacetoacetate hydrolase family protein n=1 Tax=Luteibacter aegosomatis TaxID=2911537 RepID=UPI001FF8446B|nr:fumarylacetoacetate hydrolase family protein [Luteibacter aegosomatis]UPG87692.1 fumarylacetoacetate hydrolase family protein [Luteibacter aegosomatis]